jgi:hypothetical protein
MAAMRVAFLMEHQEITDMVEMKAMALLPVVDKDRPEPPVINTESDDYLAGASDALISLVACLKQKAADEKGFYNSY